MVDFKWIQNIEIDLLREQNMVLQQKSIDFDNYVHEKDKKEYYFKQKNEGLQKIIDDLQNNIKEL